MSVYTRTHDTSRVKAKPKSTPWREVFKKEIEKYSQAGLMLRASRYKAKMTQQALADALDISQHHISEMENGKRPIDRKSVV